MTKWTFKNEIAHVRAGMDTARNIRLAGENVGNTQPPAATREWPAARREGSLTLQ